jgi:hypothetical protein
LVRARESVAAAQPEVRVLQQGVVDVLWDARKPECLSAALKVSGEHRSTALAMLPT